MTRNRSFPSWFTGGILVFLFLAGGIGFASGESLPAVMSINGPTIDEFANSPGPFTFTVAVSGGTPPYTYVWKKTGTPRMTADIFKCSQENSVTVEKDHFTTYGGLYLEVTDAKGRMATWVNEDGVGEVLFSRYYSGPLSAGLNCNFEGYVDNTWVSAERVNGDCWSTGWRPKLPATPASTVVQNKPVCAPPPEDGSWVVIVGGLAVVAVAAAAIARMLKNRPKKKGEQPPDQYILQLSKDTLKVSLKKSDSFTVTAWKVTEDGGFVAVPTAQITVTPPRNIPALVIEPAAGNGSLTPSVSLRTFPGSVTGVITITASAGGRTVSADVKVTVEGTPDIEFD